MSIHYRLLASGINCPGVPGDGWFRFERPRNNKGDYTDSDERPTLIAAAAIAGHIERHGAGCHLRLAKLLRDGALVEYHHPQPVPAARTDNDEAKGKG